MRELVIEPKKGLTRFWRELWEYRELFYFLAWRDFRVRYKQTLIGAAWSIVRPTLTMIVFSVIFGRIAKLPSGDVPYPIMVYAAMLPWQFFSTTIMESAISLVRNAHLITKVYFPRIVLPFGALFVNLVDFFMASIVLVLLMIWYGFAPDWKILFAPLFLLLAGLTSVGAGLFMAALNVKFRDFQFVLPFLVQLGLYISPVGFSSDVVPDKWRLLYSLNPMVGVIDGFRWCLLGSEASFYIPGLILSVCLALALFCGGIWFFIRTERGFADVI